MKFIPRTSAPSATNKYYIKAGKGGYNRAMEINSQTHSCLPNCVAMAHGRWLECRNLTDYNKYDKLPTGNAENYYPYTKDGYKRGQEPKVGAIICWRKGEAGKSSDGAGHVAFVEEVKSNGDVVTSNSAYHGSRYYLKTYKKSNNYYMGSKYHFQGFIYNPEEFDNVTPTVDRDVNKNQVQIITKNLRVRKEASTTSDIIGFAEYKGIYNYYETSKDSQYTWYRIDDNQWVANNGKYLAVYPKTEKYNLTRLLEAKKSKGKWVCGSQGNDVKELQKELKNRGYNIGKSGIDGKFGNDTRNAVIKFQKDNKISADGVVGKNTAHKLGWLYKGK